LQTRFAHLFDGSSRAAEDLAGIQAVADRNVARFGLVPAPNGKANP
jgi:hypothetical protein